ncbi:MAG: transaldolase [Ignavibacteria bacterium]|nr:transaldolase [Ignavibacteria bacterium]
MLLKDLRIKIFADGANEEEIIQLYKGGLVKGFTTNPTLMKKDGVKDYEKFARSLLEKITDLPISFEVFSDDFETMEKQAKKIQSWGKNVFVKIPITNTQKESSVSLINKLSNEGLNLNITAILTTQQVSEVIQNIYESSNTIISVFAGRIADTGRDPIPYMKKAKELISGLRNVNLLWASSRELLNIFQAEECGCDIITVTNDILKKIHLINKDLEELSLDTVKMFYNDGKAVGFKIL